MNKKHGFAYSSKLVDMQKLVESLRGYPEIVFLQLIFYEKMFLPAGLNTQQSSIYK